MSCMDKSFQPTEIESRWYPQWEASGYFAPSGDGEPYTIMLPPPNVTGTLHMGHAFQHTIMDTLIRYQRMCGKRALWQLGTDHAGIATEMVVSRLLEREGQTRNALGREQFVERVWQWKEESGSTISRQMRRMGVSGDWSRERFTMDEGLSKAVVETFVRLHDEGLIYRGQRLVNWDPVLLTAISDLEVVSEEENGKLWSIAYPLADGSGQLVVATTRPETMLGDVAVAVHPEDERYAQLIGKMLKLPLTEREIPIIADAYVDKDFGTGCVKITPAHDFNDYEIGKRHALPMINIFTPTATINDAAPEKYRGLDRYVARKAVLADLTALELLVEEKPHKLQVPRGDRTGQVIEPYLTYQWFVKMDGLAARGLELVENGSVKFVPENWINTYRHWLGNIQDWCISRQLWWGHRIPAWYGAGGEIFVARDEAGARAQAEAAGYRGALTRDDDVLETWFSSALWSHSTLGWPDADAMKQFGFDTFLPTSVLVTGFDIIFFWVARMIMMTDHFTGQVPFKHVYITGLVRDRDGNKMSKSKGNVLDPLDLIDGIALDDLIAKRTSGLMQPKDAARIEAATRKEFPQGIAAVGADALRFTFASLASHGRDIKFDFNRCEGYKNFCNKLWNAARFVLMNTESFVAPAGTPVATTEPERWILTRLAATIDVVHAQLADYRFDLASQALYEFTWNEYCDWFLELAKPALAGDDVDAANSTRHTLLYVLETVLRALHPLIPFVTEEIWQHVSPKLGVASGQFIATQRYPQAADIAVDPAATAEVQWLKDVLMGVRRIRGEMNIAPGKAIPMLFAGGDGDDARRVAKFSAQIAFLAKSESLRLLAATEEAPASASAIVGTLRVLIPLAGLIDLDAEKKRLDREITRVEVEIKKCQGKLASETFVANAPVAVVEQERARLGDWNVQLDGLRSQRAKLG
ncbi:MAG: valine--tRNA ligase [Rhodanobacteraceae bacterium]|nr:valine--tRNA ligase [Rhodanobacteraceae bacterium]MBL0042514.1 valine--tRNA ligase [Xanthomonadales bacterium]MBP6077240.1 valine--tRNA ligase [Xanthomonadales bacterium]MBP7622748.1 valine--tRNA ligase [Xanthomonadales bacterium]